MNEIVEVQQFWRIGRRENPIHVSVEYQGDGRFDDPQKLVAVLYGAPTLRTCLLELMLPVQVADAARAVLTAVSEPTDELEAADRINDLRIAEMPRIVPPSLYQRVAVLVSAPSQLKLIDLRSLAMRQRIEALPQVAIELRKYNFPQLDRSALLSQRRPLTQAITRSVLHGDVGDDVDGIFSESRISGEACAIFLGGGHNPELQIIGERKALTSEDPDVAAVARELGLQP